MIQIMADQLYRVEKEKEKGLPIISSRRKRALPLFDNNANHGNGKTRKTLTIDYPSLVNAANTRGRVQRARMLDVLRYLVSSFDPEVPDNRLHLHQRFQNIYFQVLIMLEMQQPIDYPSLVMQQILVDEYNGREC